MGALGSRVANDYQFSATNRQAIRRAASTRRPRAGWSFLMEKPSKDQFVHGVVQQVDGIIRRLRETNTNTMLDLRRSEGL